MKNKHLHLTFLHSSCLMGQNNSARTSKPVKLNEMVWLQTDLPTRKINTGLSVLLRILFLPHYDVLPSTVSVQQTCAGTAVTITTTGSGRNLLTIALRSTQNEKGVPLKTSNVGRFRPLRTTKKDKGLKKKLMIVRQAHFPPLAELGHEAFRRTMV